MELITTEGIDSIKETLVPIAEKIGEGAGYGWEVLVWGQFAEGVGMLIISLLVGLITYFGSKKLLDIAEETDGASLVGLIVTVLTGLFSLIMLYDGLIAVIAPEYSAIKMLLGLAGGN